MNVSKPRQKDPLSETPQPPADFEITEEEFPELYALTMEAVEEFKNGLVEKWP